MCTDVITYAALEWTNETQTQNLPTHKQHASTQGCFSQKIWPTPLIFYSQDADNPQIDLLNFFCAIDERAPSYVGRSQSYPVEEIEATDEAKNLEASK